MQQVDYLFVPTRGSASRVHATLLHPFTDSHAPDISGTGTGTFLNPADTSFAGKLLVNIEPLERGAFPGHVDFIPDSAGQPSLSWDLRATTSGTNRFVMIAQGKTGKLVADGVALPPKGNKQTSTFVGGIAQLRLLEGPVHFVAYNFSVR